MINAKVLRADRFAEIGSIIQRDVGIILDNWTRKAVQEQSQGKRVHHQILLDHLPALLKELGKGLAESGDPLNSPHSRLAALHGEQRWEVGWSLNEVIRDYQILRMTVLEYLDEVLERPLRLREVLAVGLALDEAIEASVSRFMEFCNEQTNQHSKALHAADRRKNEFLATLSHELRNPLAPLHSSLDVLRLNRSDPAIVDQAREIMERQVKQMTRLVDDLYDMSRIALGKLELRKERLDLRTVLTQVVQMNTPFAQSRRQKVAVELPTEPLWVEGDQSRLVQIFINLLNNSVKFTPNGGRLKLQVFSQVHEVVVRVQDNGVGIPSEMLSRIFDLFTQIDLGSDRVQGGLGIGLSLVRQLVELHGGKIAAKSAGINQGSEFLVTLPLSNGDQSAQPISSESVGTSTKRRILLIEDNADARNSMMLLLKLVGHDVIAAENGQRGIEAATQGAFDFALIDIGLPDIDGYEVAAKLRSILGPEPVLIALTGFSQPEARQRAIEAGFQTHVVKPVDLQTLQALLVKYITNT